MVAPGKPVIIDASVVLAWLLPDERISKSANKLYSWSATGEISLVAPTLLLYEVLNGLRSAVAQKRLKQSLLQSAVEQFLNLDINLYPQPGMAKEIVALAIKLKLSVYDSTYVSLAKKLDTTMYTADKKLARKISKIVKIKVFGN